VDTKPLTENGSDAQVTSMNSGGDSGEAILSAEIEMIRSLDSCDLVAKAIGPGKILSKGQGTNDIEAAFLIQKQLVPSREKGSDVIRLVFSHPDREIVVPVLGEIIRDYQAKHDDVRRPKTGEDLSSGIDSIKAKMAEAEGRLRDEQKKVDVISLDESKKAVQTTLEKAASELNEVVMEREVTATILKAMKGDLPAAADSRMATSASTPAAPPEVAPAIIQEYKQDSTLLASLQAEESELLSWTTTNNKQVQAVEARIARTEKSRNQLEEKNPGLIAIKAVVANSSNPTAQDPIVTYNQALLRAETLDVRYGMLTNQLAAAHERQNRILTAEATLLDLQRECELYRTTLEYYKRRQAEADANGALDAGNTQIRSIEQPTPARGDYMAITKLCAGILVGGLALAFGLPFFIELYLDQTLKRPLDIQNRLGVPFFISMPKLKNKFHLGALKAERIVPLLPASSGDATAADPSALATPEVVLPAVNGNGNGNGHIAPWEQRHALRPFFETLRDRLMTYFEVINLTHKPKLVAITSCGEGAGVTTTAAGLASALSETGEGNVLLVNMNAQDGEAHHFYRGKLTCGLEEALERDKRNAACIHENLFVAKDIEVNENLPRVLPKRFSHLVPKMRASDYDYIIFDMPPMSQISITPRLARFMDMVLLVVESEKTDRDVAKRATNLLLETKTNVGVVLNKSRDHLPRRLQQDI
jgi:Mrp family chromosome partitioning ATPase